MLNISNVEKEINVSRSPVSLDSCRLAWLPPASLQHKTVEYRKQKAQGAWVDAGYYCSG